MPEEKQEKLFEEIEKIKRERIGVGRHKKLHELVKKLKNIYMDFPVKIIICK